MTNVGDDLSDIEGNGWGQMLCIGKYCIQEIKGQFDCFPLQVESADPHSFVGSFTILFDGGTHYNERSGLK